MSKMDNLRAMREERYERARARAKTATPGASAAKTAKVAPSDASDATGAPATRKSAAPKKTAQKTAEPSKPDDSGSAQGTGPTDEELCGHRSMNGRTCTREKGHSAKSHRYS
ncbi:hypothetical protein BJ980_003685 [Nocardioides daedukensis]|uniref:Uncharacterized protein n=1 Tax=Nocardioides daedukensis TaxID=634462 RepID=A0A7Y9URT7_9ACTN|nr:hypothetical protein [Nocardioides daedukensis]NYG60762.1 hypothetical protein [Nocardioides daedukensis]